MTSWWKYFLAALTGWMLLSASHWLAHFSAVPLKDNCTGKPCRKVGRLGLSWKMPLGQPRSPSGEFFEFVFYDYLLWKNMSHSSFSIFVRKLWVSIKMDLSPYVRTVCVFWDAICTCLYSVIDLWLVHCLYLVWISTLWLHPETQILSFFWCLPSDHHAADVCDVVFAVSCLLPVTIRFTQERPKHHHPHLAARL